MSVSRLLHVSILVADTRLAEDFYEQILGLNKSQQRPDLGYPGCWFEIGEHQLHLIQKPNPDPVHGRPAHAGHDRHVAFAVEDLDELIGRLHQHGIVYSRSKSGRKAVFFRDPDGNALELVEDGGQNS